MTIEIHNSEAEAIIRQRMTAGGFRTPEEVIVQALKSSPDIQTTSSRPAGRVSLAQLFANSPFEGLDIEFERDSDYGRDAPL